MLENMLSVRAQKLYLETTLQKRVQCEVECTETCDAGKSSFMQQHRKFYTPTSMQGALLTQLMQQPLCCPCQSQTAIMTKMLYLQKKGKTKSAKHGSKKSS